MNEPLRIAMIILGYYPIIGGAEVQLRTLARQLQAQGVEVSVLTRRYAGLKAFELVDGIPVYRLLAPRPKPVAALSFIATAIPLLRRLRPHVVHAFTMLSPAIIACVAKMILGIPAIVGNQGGGRGGEVYRLHNKFLSNQRFAFLRRYVDAYITISQEIDRELEQIGMSADRRVFILNGVDTNRFSPVSPTDKQLLRARLGLPSGPMAIFVGRLAPEKRVANLLTIWPEVRSVYPEASLLIIGTGVEESMLKAMAGDDVHFAGAVEDVAPYLQTADLFVLPSMREGLSVAILEALSTSLPVVATAVGGTPDVIKHDYNGWLVPPENPPALRDAIVTLLGDQTRRANFGARGRELVIRNYSLATCVAQHRALYTHLASGHPIATLKLQAAEGDR